VSQHGIISAAEDSTPFVLTPTIRTGEHRVHRRGDGAGREERRGQGEGYDHPLQQHLRLPHLQGTRVRCSDGVLCCLMLYLVLGRIRFHLHVSLCVFFLYICDQFSLMSLDGHIASRHSYHTFLNIFIPRTPLSLQGYGQRVSQRDHRPGKYSLIFLCTLRISFVTRVLCILVRTSCNTQLLFFVTLLFTLCHSSSAIPSLNFIHFSLHRTGGFSLALGLKDVSLVSQAARETDTPMPFLSVLLDRYVSLCIVVYCCVLFYLCLIRISCLLCVHLSSHVYRFRWIVYEY